MPFTPKPWKDWPDRSTPRSAAALIDQEQRLSAYTDFVGGGGGLPLEILVAAPNGTDDTAVINNALVAARNISGSDLGAAVAVRLRHTTESGPYIVTQIEMQDRTALLGQSVRGTVVKQKASTTGTMVVAHQSTDAGVTDRNARWLEIAHLTLDGDKANQSAANGGILFDRDPDFSTSAADNARNSNSNDWDMHGHVHHVHIKRCKGYGFKAVGLGDHLVSDVQVNDCDGHGIECGVDNHFVNCDVGMSGLAGFYFFATNCTLVGCKAWYSGNVTPSAGGGYWFQGGYGNIVQGCIAQDNKGPGVILVANATGNRIDVICDSNNTSAAGQTVTGSTSGTALDIESGCAHNEITAICFERQASASQHHVLYVTSGMGVNNTIRAKFYTQSGAIGAVMHPSASTLAAGTVLHVNGSEDGYQSVAFSATPAAADPAAGSTWAMGVLTAGTTIPAPSQGWRGCKLLYVLQQDGTGGRTIAWNAAFKNTPTTQTGVSAYTIGRFVYDGTNWIGV